MRARCLRGLQRELALLDFGDVARRADQALGAPVGAAERDAVLARPAPCAVLGAIAHVAQEARRFALEMLDHPAAEHRQVARMDALAASPPACAAPPRAEQDAQVGRVIDGVGLDIPVVETVIDQFHRERVALFARRERVGGRVALTVGGRRDGRAVSSSRWRWRSSVTSLIAPTMR